MKLIRKRGCRGNAIIEVSLMAPWIFFLFVGVLDFGFYAYAVINVQNAARNAVMMTAENPAVSSTAVCNLVLQELSSFPGGAGPCTAGSPPSLVPPGQVYVNITAPAALDSEPNTAASSVSVTVGMMNMIPIPGVLVGPKMITRTAQARAKG